MSELKRHLEIEQFADRARQSATVHDTFPVPMKTVAFRISDIRPDRKIALLINFDDEMVSDDAYTDTVNSKIYMKQSVYDELETSSRAKFTLAHEIGHVLMHQSNGALSRSVSGKNVRAQAGAKNIALFEREANQFAAAFLMPREKVDLNLSTKEISTQFGVTEKTAEVRKNFLLELQRKELGQKRKLTPGMLSSLKKLGISTNKFE